MEHEDSPLIFCIQCIMEAMVVGNPPPVFSETVKEHFARVHPDLEATKTRRLELEQLLNVPDEEEPDGSVIFGRLPDWPTDE